MKFWFVFLLPSLVLAALTYNVDPDQDEFIQGEKLNPTTPSKPPPMYEFICSNRIDTFTVDENG